MPNLRFDYAGQPVCCDVPRTVKLLSELEKSWAMFAASWKVVDLIAGMQIWQEQAHEEETSSRTCKPLNSVLLSTSSIQVCPLVPG